MLQTIRIVIISIIITPIKIYTKLAGNIFSNKPEMRIQTAITDIPIPIVLQSRFSSYLAF